MCLSCKSLRGFTLVELSIVIVVIGLIVAAVSAGSSLVKQSQLRVVLSDIGKYRTAVNAYKVQYEALPGDHVNAYSFFGASCDATASNCNGNGNSQIELSSVAADNEFIRFWQHLALAGLISGSYTGVSVSGGDGNVVKGGVNAPKSAYGKNITFYPSYAAGSGSWTSQNVTPGHIILWGKEQTGTASWQAFLPVNDAYNIDIKEDDGKPFVGRILGAHSGSCATGSNAAGVYQVDTTNICAMGFYF